MTETVYMEPAVKPMHVLHAKEINNTNASQGLKLLVITY